MASTMGEDPNAFGVASCGGAAQQCNKLAEVRDENSIRTHRGENTGRTFPLPVRQLPWGTWADGTAGAAEASFLPFTRA
jgi:hypothetical protein